MTASHRFPRQARVRAKADFDRIFKHGRRVALPVLALHWLDENVAADQASAARASADGLTADASPSSDAPGRIAGELAATGGAVPVPDASTSPLRAPDRAARALSNASVVR